MQVMLYCDVSASEVLLPLCYPPHLPRSDSCILKSQQYSVLAMHLFPGVATTSGHIQTTSFALLRTEIQKPGVSRAGSSRGH